MLDNILHLVMYGGISMIIWGILLGSWFGDAVQQISKGDHGHGVCNLAGSLRPAHKPHADAHHEHGARLCPYFHRHGPFRVA